MNEQRRGGNLARRTLGIGLAAVEPALNRPLQPAGLGRVFGLDHSLGELAQFLRAELATFPRAPGKLNDPVLLIARLPPYFLNDLNRCHGITLLVRTPACKPGRFVLCVEKSVRRPP